MEGLEPPHTALETAALPVELHPYRADGEPRTRYLQFGGLTCTPLHLTGILLCAVRVSIPRPQIKNLGPVEGVQVRLLPDVRDTGRW